MRYKTQLDVELLTGENGNMKQLVPDLSMDKRMSQDVLSKKPYTLLRCATLQPYYEQPIARWEFVELEIALELSTNHSSFSRSLLDF